MSAIVKEDFEKSLQRLENLAKSQLFHTASDSEPGSWAGSSPEDEDSMDDNIQDNGTDYDGVKKSLVAKAAKGAQLTKAEASMLAGGNPFKAISKKVAKGLKLTKAEAWALKNMNAIMPSAGAASVSKADVKPGEAPAPGEVSGADSAVETHAGSAKNEDDTQEEAHKSLGDRVQKSQAIQSGIELSPFLAEFVHAVDLALRGNEKAISKSLAKALAPLAARIETLEKSYAKSLSEDNEFKKGLAEAVVGIGQQVSGTAALAAETASQPARAPKAQLRSIQSGQGVQAVNKSFNGGEGVNEGLAKSQALAVMTDLVKANQLSPLEVIKYETTGEMSPQVQQRVFAAVNGGSR